MQDLTAISITFGIINSEASLDTPLDNSFISNPINCMAVYEDDEIIGFAIQNDNNYIFDNAEEVDGDALRSSLNDIFKSQWNRILLCSVDIDELADEADMPYHQFYIDEQPDLHSELGDLIDYEGWIGVHTIKGTFVPAESEKVKQFLNFELEKSSSIPMDKFGEIEDFNTESEMFVLFDSDWRMKLLIICIKLTQIYAKIKLQ